MNTTGHYLLTGAGFTHNFGGPLATEMWAMILNHKAVQGTPALRRRLLNDFDFESVYNAVIADGNAEELEAMQDALLTAYRSIDDSLRSWTFSTGSPFPVNIYKVQELIAQFAGPTGQTGFVFTLNQDLLLERHYYNGPRPSLPGIRGSQDWFTARYRAPLGPESFARVPAPEEVEALRSRGLQGQQLCYLKLHGSCNWQSSDLQTRMVIGRGKADQIQQDPLLAWYLDVFAECLGSQDSRLLVIGYGFSDSHINQLLAEAANTHGLRLCVITPQEPAAFKKHLTTQEHGEALWQSLVGYYQATLAGLFPTNQEVTGMWESLVRDFFPRKRPWPS